MGELNQSRQLAMLDCWSAYQEELAVPAAAADQALPDVVVADLPFGAVVVKAIAMFKARTIENTYAGVNKLSGAQHIQVRDDTPGTWRDAISFPDDLFTLAPEAREGCDLCMGDHDIAVEVDGNDTYNFQWDEAVADQASILFNDIQVGLKIWYRLG